MNIGQLRKDLRNLATPQKAKASAWFFKTGEGQYGYGDKFLGVTVPEQRKIAKKYLDIPLEDLDTLLKSEFHEERLTALFILVGKYERAAKFKKNIGSSRQVSNNIDIGNSQTRNDECSDIFDFYVKHISYINNWDLVDSSAHKIIGEFIKDKKITLLISFTKSENLWKRRIAVISTFAFLNDGSSQPTYAICDLLLSDRHDLIQKAVGWSLREAGKKVSQEELIDYLNRNYKKMGRTALRYAIERFPKEQRAMYLTGNV